MKQAVCRFAPSTSGPAHLGTLAAALLAWLDARSLGARFVVRLEDLDRERCRPEFRDPMLKALQDLGLDWDELVLQSDRQKDHEAALDRLENKGLLYPCSLTRRELRAIGRRGPDGSFAYDNRARGHALPAGGWRACEDPLRANLGDTKLQLSDESGLDLSQNPGESLGDPIVLRRDGACAYQLAVVVDDAASGVTRVVRGRDIAPSTATQVRLQQLLGLPQPAYRHHLLLLEKHGEKLSKSHGALAAFAAGKAPAQVVGALAQMLGLRGKTAQITPRELLCDFDWSRVRDADWLLGAD